MCCIAHEKKLIGCKICDQIENWKRACASEFSSRLFRFCSSSEVFHSSMALPQVSQSDSIFRAILRGGKSSGGWEKIKLKLPHSHASDTCRVSIEPTLPLQQQLVLLLPAREHVDPGWTSPATCCNLHGVPRTCSFYIIIILRTSILLVPSFKLSFR